MESGVLGQPSLSNLEFEAGETAGIPAFAELSLRSIPLPDELPAPASRRDLPKDILKSSTVENLISQNEDLMARLKVALRRLSVLEDENHRVLRESENLRHQASVAEDQRLVLKEKDRAWKGKTDELQQQKDLLAEKNRALESRLNAQEAELERLRRFQDKVEGRIKPHLVQLKEYAKDLEGRLARQENEVARRDASIQDLRHQIIEVTKNSRQQVEIAESRTHELIESYEKSIEDLREQLSVSQSVRQDLELRSARLRRTEQRCDELENECIELRRSKEELSQRFGSECQRLMDQGEESSRESAKLKIENEDLRAKVLDDHGRIQHLEKQSLDLQAQLESLRYLWTSRNDENERLKLSLSALEKINLDLSSKLQELRNG
ncbi:MAG: hypothetical protein KF802_01510 [Bdellovibrionaceae bacterium]|nr:hypothetical protein [Pseudobdellovibrionaceae bacterium]MBX3034866.1 hypothetical protein [Pseudobdellovibrionaceae bacterium]